MITPNEIVIGAKMLITCDNWFITPDGTHKRAVFGTVKAVVNAEQCLGIKVNSRSADWYVEIGNLTIAGCQIHYAIQTKAVWMGPVNDYKEDSSVGIVTYMRPSVIYNADADLNTEAERIMSFQNPPPLMDARSAGVLASIKKAGDT